MVLTATRHDARSRSIAPSCSAGLPIRPCAVVSGSFTLAHEYELSVRDCGVISICDRDNEALVFFRIGTYCIAKGLRACLYVCRIEPESASISLTTVTPPSGGLRPSANWPPRARSGSRGSAPSGSSSIVYNLDVLEDAECGLVARGSDARRPSYVRCEERLWRAVYAAHFASKSISFSLLGRPFSCLSPRRPSVIWNGLLPTPQSTALASFAQLDGFQGHARVRVPLRRRWCRISCIAPRSSA